MISTLLLSMLLLEDMWDELFVLKVDSFGLLWFLSTLVNQ